MAFLIVATSKTLAEWAADVGLSKHVFKVAVADGPAPAAIEAMNKDAHAGQTDWKLLRKQEVDGLDEATAFARLALREKMIDPALYPRIKGAAGIFKVKFANVGNYRIIKAALAGEQIKLAKVKPADIASYLIEVAMNAAQ